MSGGSFDYEYQRVNNLADAIEAYFIKDGKYQEEDWSTEPDYSKNYRGKRKTIEKDRIGDATPEERPIILEEINSLIADLKKCAIRAKELEWYMSGDTGATSYLERLKKAGVLKP